MLRPVATYRCRPLFSGGNLVNIFNENCTQCDRLASFLAEVRQQQPRYHARPVAPFGDSDPSLLIVGLAPGMHGANATGRPFTGDFAGILLYKTLYDFGFSNQALSESVSDGLELINCRITNAVKCLPPQNKPLGEEIRACNQFLKLEIESLKEKVVLLALGTIAHNAVIRACQLRQCDYPFGHNRVHLLPTGQYLLDSYHCSRYNTQTRRLTGEMFDDVFRTAKKLIG